MPSLLTSLHETCKGIKSVSSQLLIKHSKLSSVMN